MIRLRASPETAQVLLGSNDFLSLYSWMGLGQTLALDAPLETHIKIFQSVFLPEMASEPHCASPALYPAVRSIF